MKNITRSALAALFAQVSSVTEIEFVALTDARLRKNPFGKVLKEARVIAEIGVNYQREVKIALLKDWSPLSALTFKAAPRVWGEHGAGAIIVNKGKLYVAMHIKKSMFPRFLQPLGLNTFAELTKRAIQKYMPAKYFSNRQAKAGLENAEKQVKHVTYSLDAFRQILIGGEEYTVVEG